MRDWAQARDEGAPVMEKEGWMEPAVCSGCMGCGTPTEQEGDAMGAGPAGGASGATSRSVNSGGMSTPRLSADASGLCHGRGARVHSMSVSDQSDNNPKAGRSWGCSLCSYCVVRVCVVEASPHTRPLAFSGRLHDRSLEHIVSSPKARARSGRVCTAAEERRARPR